MYVVIASAGRTGAQLANLLLSQNHEVRVVENRKMILSRVHKDLPTEVIVEGDPLDPEVLELAGIRHANALAACLTDDEVNLSLCYFAREIFNIPRTIARVNNPRNAWLFNDLFHVDVVVNHAEIMANLIQEELSVGDMMTMLKLKRGNYSLMGEKIPPGAPAIGMAIRDLALPEHCVIAAIIRKGEVIVPRGVTVFEGGDEILAISDSDGAKELVALFSEPEEGPAEKKK